MKNEELPCGIKAYTHSSFIILHSSFLSNFSLEDLTCPSRHKDVLGGYIPFNGECSSIHDDD